MYGNHIVCRRFKFLVSLSVARIAFVSSAVRRSVINIAPSNTTGTLGGTVELACAANDSHTANVRWRKDGQPIDAPSSRHVLLRSGTLRIVGLRRSDAGEYVCTVSSASGQQAAVAYITIAGWCCARLEVSRTAYLADMHGSA